FVDAELPVVIDGVIALAVDLEETDVLLHDIAIGEEDGVGADRANVSAGDATGQGGTINAASAGIQVTPDTEVKGESAEGRSNATIDIDSSRRTIRKGNAFRGRADVKLQVLGDVITR